MHFAMGVEYNGAHYHGWQSQLGLTTVQGSVEAALSKLAHQPIKVQCAGRTDVGVHATGQVIHFDSDAKRADSAWVCGTNTYLDSHIRILWVKEVPVDFHARFKALTRRYRYIIDNNPVVSGIFKDQVTWVRHPLCEKSMAKAAQCFLGEHDFSAYRASGCQARNPIRKLYRFDIHRRGPMVVMDIEGSGFLHHMVRNIAGVLVKIGEKKQPITWAQELLLALDRRLGAATASPKGLYLVDVTYPPEYALKRSALGPLFLY